MSIGFENIRTLKKGDLTLTVPFSDWSEASLRVSTSVFGVDTILSQGPDYSVIDGVVIVNPKYRDFPITIASVLCPELQLPKFGTVENDVIQDAFNGLKNYIGFLEARLNQFMRLPSCPEDECLIAVYEDRKVTWVSPAAIAEKLSVFGVKSPCKPIANVSDQFHINDENVDCVVVSDQCQIEEFRSVPVDKQFRFRKSTANTPQFTVKRQGKYNVPLFHSDDQMRVRRASKDALFFPIPPCVEPQERLSL